MIAILLFVVIVSSILILRYKVQISRKKIFRDFTNNCTPINTYVRHLPLSDTESIVKDYKAKIFIVKNGLLIIPEVTRFQSSEIFLFVHAKIYSDNFPKPDYLGIILDYRIYLKTIVITATIKKTITTIRKFEMIIEVKNEVDSQTIKDFLDDDL